MDTEINELVKVWVFFNNGIFPIAISWRRRLVKFSRVIFQSSKQIGQTKLTNLICEADGANFELEYNNENYSWKLKKVMPIS